MRALRQFAGGAWAFIYAYAHCVIGKQDKPPHPQSFIIDQLADGARRFSWRLDPIPADIRAGGGFQIRYITLPEGQEAPIWEELTLLNEGLLRVSPYETNARHGLLLYLAARARVRCW